ncbi:MAG: formylglycine-generating enzyme family protein [Magnetococcales bacterium]|nr:formylglycine-generating enzyme family protein [Magnetococcales bacterium]MBF0149596.1 formylglycine-generating enzyme family protein [Magnetococcales bacterium]MBF0347866.1 formylglycine-generating enzyme family protein [Magnetococcales bacterium]
MPNKFLVGEIMGAARWVCVLVFMIPGMVWSEPAKTWTNSIGMEFVLIPSGTFMMGEKRIPGGDDDNPLHEVTLRTPFCLGKYEVTQSQWQAIMGDNPSAFKGANRPVENVSWNDVHEFVKRLNMKEETGNYRLPTEAEWEYAARAGTTGRFSWGAEELTVLYAWYHENSEKETHPVGQKLPNAWGLYDMAGNVWEWCQDWYARGYDHTPGSDPTGPISGVTRVYRGGSWIGDPPFVRHANRSRLGPGRRNGDVGFRLVMMCHPSFPD